MYSINETVFGESTAALSFKEIRRRDPYDYSLLLLDFSLSFLACLRNLKYVFVKVIFFT